ncbi:hypothetical protein LDK47_16105 [Lactiplantibacillus plantarum]|nr:hypothetical protein [Lactiplantibacillus plantarum]MCW6174307.1 hypothetical protein [Lactiplantibacillus plantarum]
MDNKLEVIGSELPVLQAKGTWLVIKVANAAVSIERRPQFRLLRSASVCANSA